MPNVSTKKVFWLSIPILIVQLLLSKYVYPTIFGQTTQTMFAVQPVSGIGGHVFGDKILGYLTGLVNFDLGSWMVWLVMFIGTFLLLYAGMFLYEQRSVKLWQGRNIGQRLFAILLYGHVALYVLLMILKWGSVPGLALSLGFGLIVNLFFVAGVIALSNKYFNFPKI